MTDVKLRVWTTHHGRLEDFVVSLPGDTRVGDVVPRAAAALERRTGRIGMTVTSVRLYPHWNREADGDAKQV